MSDRRPSTSLLARAEALIALRRYDEAIPLLQEAAAFEPSSALIRCQLAVCLLGVGQFRAAVATAGEAIASAPDDEWPHRIRARGFLCLNRRHRALAAAKEAARLAPDEVLTQAMLSEAELANHHWRAARAAAEVTREIGPDRPDGHNALAAIAMRTHRWKEAEGHCRRAVEADPENVEALNNLGLVLLKRGRPRAAVSYFSDASRLDPRSSEPRLNALRASLGLSAPSVGAVLFGVVLFFQAGTLGERIGGSVLVLAVTGAVVALHRRRRARHATDPLPAATLLRRLREEAIRSFITPPTPVLWAVLVLALGFLAGSVSVVANPPPGTIVAGWLAWGAFVGALAVVCGRALLRRRATARR